MEIYNNYYVKRFVAFLIDYCSLGICSFLLLFLISYLHSYILFILLEIILIIGCLLYEPFLLSRFGTTIGKRIMQLEVIDEEGYFLSFKMGVIRMIGKLLSIAVIGLGFIPMFFNKKKKTIYDTITKSIVYTRVYEEKSIKKQVNIRKSRCKENNEIEQQSTSTELVGKSRLNRKQETETAAKTMSRLERRNENHMKVKSREERNKYK